MSSLFVLGLFFVMAWSVAAWYFGVNTEAQFKSYLSESDKIPGKRFFRVELLEYKNTLLGATARLRVSSDFAFINQRIGDVELDARLQNGPVFLDNPFAKISSSIESANDQEVDFGIDQRLYFGTALWRFELDTSTLEPSETEYIHSIFPAGLPVATIRIDFENKAHYKLKLNTSFAESLISGVYNLENADNQGKVLMSNIRYGVGPNVLTAMQALIRYHHQRSISTAHKPVTTRLSVTDLILNHELLEKPLNINLNAKAKIQSNRQQIETGSNNEISDLLNGLIKVDLEQKSTEYLPIEVAEIKLQFNDIPVQGFVTFSEERARQDNLRKQIQWALEESAELPEGQDHIWQLNDQLQTMQQQFPERLASTLFKLKDSQVQVLMTAGKSSIADKSIFKGTLDLSTKAKDSTITPSHVLGLLNGKAQVSLTDELFEFLSPKVDLQNVSFKLALQQGKVTLVP